MPKSKRSQLVTLTQTAKKTRDHKASYIQDVREALDTHDAVYLFSYENMRSNKFKNVRLHFRDEHGSRIFLGKNKLLQIALGRTEEEEYHEHLRHVAKRTSGSVGLLCTSRNHKDVTSYFATLSEDDFARAGSTAPRTIYITSDMVATHPVSMVEQFKALGVPVEIKTGKLVLRAGGLDNDTYKLCKEGDVLTAEMCKALVHFGIQLSEFRVQLVCRWSKSGGFDEL